MVSRATGAEVKLARAPFNGFIADWELSAQRAMQAEPLYFARWYTVKSIALVGVSLALLYTLMKRRSTAPRARSE